MEQPETPTKGQHLTFPNLNTDSARGREGDETPLQGWAVVASALPAGLVSQALLEDMDTTATQAQGASWEGLGHGVVYSGPTLIWRHQLCRRGFIRNECGIGGVADLAPILNLLAW